MVSYAPILARWSLNVRLIITLMTVFFMTQPVNAAPCPEQHCVAIVDAGSSGSRLHIYAYDDENGSPSHIQELYDRKIQPGFATITLDQENIQSYLTNLFSNVPYTNIPVYFYSTAGMRLLPNHKQRAFYELLKNWFATQSQWQLIDAKTITGQEEGMYGWLAVNYQLGTLSSDANSSVGVMDTGGASVQITFPLTDARAVNPEDIVDLTIHGKHIQLFVHSFLGLGQHELSHQFLDVPDCYSTGYELPSHTLGQGNLLSCREKITALINRVHQVDKTIKPVMKTNSVNTWYALGGIGYIVQTKPLNFQDLVFTMNELETAANPVFCQQNWKALNDAMPNDDYLYSSCFNTAYIYALLIDGYGLQQDQRIRFFSSEQNNNDWTLGVVLRH